MTIGTLLLCIVLAGFGLNCALIGWFVLRFTAGPIAALASFWAVLSMTTWGILQIATFH